MYMFIEFIISGNTSYTYWLVFISILHNQKKSFTFYIQLTLILKYICFKEFWIINQSKLLKKYLFVKSKMLPNLFYRILFFLINYIYIYLYPISFLWYRGISLKKNNYVYKVCLKIFYFALCEKKIKSENTNKNKIVLKIYIQ